MSEPIKAVSKRRDKIVVKVCNWLLRLASEGYRTKFRAIVVLGTQEMDKLVASTKRVGETTLLNVHDEAQCVGRPCTIHNPSDHHMKDWPQHWRDDKRLMERICEHGVGHPDPDDVWFKAEQGDLSASVHGCDGCCASA